MATELELDLLEQLTTDHDVLRVRFSELAGLPLGDPRRERLAFLTADTLVRHLAAEDEYLYPIAGHGRPAVDEAVTHGRHSHTAMYGLVRELRASRAGSAEFDRLLARLIEEATGHFGLEEARVFPTVREQATPVRLVALGEQARDTERTPSRCPRPPAPAPPCRRTTWSPPNCRGTSGCTASSASATPARTDPADHPERRDRGAPPSAARPTRTPTAPRPHPTAPRPHPDRPLTQRQYASAPVPVRRTASRQVSSSGLGAPRRRSRWSRSPSRPGARYSVQTCSRRSRPAPRSVPRRSIRPSV
ncbi:hypothetical protein KCH_06980 [Kitasatospora cheerisanensis KCTC 2395]|uniref:Hemerythrin-like domain-containing protein n=1 Tax=Kitasatospora cheerisanensis KCTC 2395 TaxID=1348663 RepID=A0A066Z1D6_9ACTN|nr:hypothetical protein KCH_06980 [Kitasatospora cheerisanensis KCTC 2395]